MTTSKDRPNRLLRSFEGLTFTHKELIHMIKARKTRIIELTKEIKELEDLDINEIGRI